jgi:hypothetical protein
MNEVIHTNNVLIEGNYGDYYMHALFTTAIGYSRVPYHMQAQLIEVLPDMSARVCSYARVGEGRWYFHTDRTRCASYPCTHGDCHAFRATVYYYEYRETVVPYHAWLRMRSVSVKFDCTLNNGTRVKIGYLVSNK